MPTASEQLEIDLKAKLFRGFGDPSRLCILDALRVTPLTVSQLVEATDLTQSNVSNHLGCLKDCGLVMSQQSGRYVTYRLSDDRVAELLELSESFLADIARGIYECTRYDMQDDESETTLKD
ncbi:MAG: transcriptional regulator [Anaerolineaceae bacterium]|jgi:DNA-binding transcriptional ArsR family regulator|uniref:Winged helix-turn-helix transcriptional regulator n=1 Tax=Phototrophicus methaneseepsis TaxID=2710758 RepID=A0A7S8E9Z7_9CHLR|nr:metalloregulator ArsR/SmtB family transcription factor [Phototrophicus methaneseepsis]MAU11810.1 transcriptional regulator [Anaerolineaceae bacterium]QPC83096.1 winged helix-turn-helix transcriptional regulator [Phototrophicus methaneseepsis]|tara:strand:- start:42 stop:407 length:366 start_codon:yes stop_codon:yes gene_type:complete